MSLKAPDDSEENLWPWPRHSTRIFQGGSQWGIHGLDTLEAWELYAEGYKQAAEKLWEDRGNHCSTYLLFPLVFLYRHYVELRIKHMLFVSLEYHELPPLPKGWKLNHDIKETWDLLQARLLAISTELPEGELDNVGRLIRELHEKDPGASIFRYPTSLAGDNHLCDPNVALNSIDMCGYFDSMHQLSEFLDLLGTCMHEVIRQRGA